MHHTSCKNDSDKKFLKELFTTFLLWMISKKEMHGYEIIKSMQSDGGFPAVTASKIYPMLASLSKRGLVSQKTEMHGRRPRKLYRLTARGKETFLHAKQFVSRSKLKKGFFEDMVR